MEALVFPLIALGFIVYFRLRDRKRARSQRVPAAPVAASQPSEIFLDMRNRALRMTVADLNVDPIKNRLFGVVVEHDNNYGYNALIMFCTGDASFYYSDGGGIIGGIGREKVREGVSEVMESAIKYLPLAVRTDDIALTPPGHISFFFLTNNGIYAIQGSMSAYGGATSPVRDLLNHCSKVLFELSTETPESNV